MTIKRRARQDGITRTKFLEVSGQKATRYQRMMMESKDITRIGINAMLKGRPSVIPGILNAITIFSNRFMPRRMAAAVTYRLMK